MSLQRARSVAITVTATIPLSQLSSVSLRETGAANPVTVTLRKGSGAGAIVCEYAVPAGGSVNVIYDAPVDFSDAVGAQTIHATVAGTGTLSGALHGS